MRGRSLGKMDLGCNEEVKQRESFPKISDNIYFFFLWKKPVNVATNKKASEGNLGTKKKKKSRHSVHNPCYFHINGWFSNFLFLGFENHIICKWTSQNTRFPSIFHNISTYFFNFLSNFLYKKKNLNPSTCMEKYVKFLNKMEDWNCS